jgi:hypothetical protein
LFTFSSAYAQQLALLASGWSVTAGTFAPVLKGRFVRLYKELFAGDEFADALVMAEASFNGYQALAPAWPSGNHSMPTGGAQCWSDSVVWHNLDPTGGAVIQAVGITFDATSGDWLAVANLDQPIVINPVDGSLVARLILTVIDGVVSLRFVEL